MTLKTSTAHVTKHADRIVKISSYVTDETVEVKHIEENLNAAKSLVFDPIDCALLIITGERTLLSNEARKYILDRKDEWKAIAVKVNNLGQKLMGNFFLPFRGKSGSFQLFTDEKKALNWISHILN